MIKPATILVVALVAATPAVRAQTAAEWVAIGRARIDSGKNDDAVKAFEKAIKLDETSSANHMWLVQALGNVVGKASALRQPFIARRIKSELDRARDLAPQSLDPHEGLIDFYVQAPGIMGGSMAKARDEAAIITKLNRLRGHFAYAKIALADKDTAAVEREYRAAITDAPDSLVAYTQLAFSDVSAKRPNDAFATIERWLARHPGDPMGNYWIGRLAGATGLQLDRGEKSLRDYLALPPDPEDKARATPAQAHFRLGEILVKKGLKADARKEFGEALRLNPKLDAARRALADLNKA